MDLRYMGFEQKQNQRAYNFDRTRKGEPTMRFVVNCDLALFLKHRVGIQEGPSLCAHKLSADLDKLQQGDHELTNDDLLAYANERTEAAARKAENRPRRVAPHRNPNAPVPGAAPTYQPKAPITPFLPRH